MNPFGKRGGPAHRRKIAEVASDIQHRGWRAVFEKLFFTPNGKKKKRFADIAAVDTEMNLQEIHQIGITDKFGNPIKREREAIADIESSEDAENLKVKFHGYHKIIIFVVFLSGQYFSI